MSAIFFYSSSVTTTTTNLNSPLQSQLSLSRQLPPTRCTTAAATTNDLRVVFAAGGTGGHIYPAVAIADELKMLNPKTQFLFLGTPTGMEATAVPSSGYRFATVPAAPLARPSRIWDVKLVIQEQNSVPGIANLVLSLFAHEVFVAFNSTVECFWQRNKCVVCGNPVRLSLTKHTSSRTVARQHFFPKVEVKGKVVLVLGGSLGANAINITLLNLYYQMLNEHDYLFIIWQTGVDAFHEMEGLVRNHPRLFLSPFLHAMDLAYAAADLIVSRAGALTCSEILTTGKPCILIPSPYVAEGHQSKIAYLMAEVAGSKVIMEDELDSTTLRTAILKIVAMNALC
ncbi:hypothetical protein BUALT_Bualt07G0083000 [Buddleja alternifolia]|uniref:Uncharacterized protein n=1 Tax=Buddleja alternifolia TaxID=168488 RepID=A0AAV6XGX4_9LAMI|nr:hypothetical protein BUALT_Bualt07G0083000 [Buddleja alternifolia]